MGKSDPYATLSVGARTLKTNKIKNTVNPEWNFVGDFPIEVIGGQQLSLEIFDHDDPGSDEFLGKATVATGLVANKGEISDMWVNLEDANTGRALMSLSWLQVSNDANDIETKGPKDLAKCLLHVYLDSCKDLGQQGKKPSPLVEFNVGTGPVQSSWAKQHTLEPAFEQGFVLLVYNPHADDLHIKVIDSLMDRDKQSSVLGTLSIPMSDLLKRPGMEYARPQPFSFQDGNQGTIRLSMELKALKKPVAKPVSPGKAPKESGVPELPVKGKVGEPEIDVSPIKSSEDSVSSSGDLDKTEESTKSAPDEDTAPLLDNAVKLLNNPVKLSQSPSLDEVMASTIAPMVQTAQIDADVEDIMMPPPPEIPAPCGKVKISLMYDLPKQDLIVTVHEASGLPGGDLPDPPDPYVKLYILPQRNRKSKRKSDAVKDTVHPVYEETFCYNDVTVEDLNEQKLEVSVIDKKGIFARSPLMGRVVIDLHRILESGPLKGEWFVLEEDDDDSD